MAKRAIVQQKLPDSPEKLESTNETSPGNIERIAIDHSGSLGSLYDGYRDIIRGKLPINFLSKSNVLEELPKCALIKGRTHKSQNLLEMIEIDYELRLSIYLQMIPAHGIASLINYPQRIDENTHFLFFHQKTLTESFCDDSKDSLTSSSFGTSTTHVITEINYGIAVCIVLQLLPGPVVKILPLLKKMCDSLVRDKYPIDISQQEEDLCSQIISTTVYSNIYELTKLNKLEDVYHRIFKLKNNQSEHLRLSYKLRPISTFYPKNSQDNLKFIPVDLSTAESLEIYLIQQLSELRVLNLRLNHDLSKLLQEELNTQLEKVHRNFFKIKERHEKKLEKIRDLLIKIRKEMAVNDSIDELIASSSQTSTNRSIQELITSLDQLKSKSDFIENLQNSRFEYCNVDKLNIKQSYSEQLIKDILRANFSDKIILCSSDEIRHKDKNIWTEKYSEVVNKCKNNPQPSLVYADFSYSTYALKKIMIIPARGSTANGNGSNCQPAESNVKRKSPSPPTDEIINILLLGESGVVKSTFINAFANYLHFQTLEQAQRGEPMVIIPVTFLMTINDNFDEKEIKFGQADSNENHNNSGQSVTQQCKSYVFNISNGKKLRIIDTPGFGDTRGSDQDNLNMEEIFSFVNNLTYLNGICLLFKPEVIQLNPYFRSCCTQLFDYFGKNIRDYFIFCFTNARSTFFAPGNTRPLLNTFFDSFPVNNIPFEKRNTFCFDSESFRYLVAKKNHIKFDNSEKNEFEQSWLRSVAESERFRDYLIDQNPYSRNDKWKSIKDAQFQINYMIRPILEGMRNLLRNIHLYDLNLSIELRPTRVKRSQVVCYTCKRTAVNYGQFLILSDQLHDPSNKCAYDDQKRTEYVLHYVLLNAHGDKPLADLKKQLNTLCEISAKFSYFLMKTSQFIRDDPFLTGLERMITEEKLNCQIGTSDHLNERLTNGLKQLREKYEKQLEIIKSDGENINLWNIYDSIKTTNEIPMVKVQLDAISKHHRYLQEKNQHTIHANESN